MSGVSTVSQIRAKDDAPSFTRVPEFVLAVVAWHGEDSRRCVQIFATDSLGCPIGVPVSLSAEGLEKLRSALDKVDLR